MCCLIIFVGTVMAVMRNERRRKATTTKDEATPASRPLLIILKTTKPYEIWYTPSHIGVVATNRRYCQRNHHIKILLGLWYFPPPLLIPLPSSSILFSFVICSNENTTQEIKRETTRNNPGTIQNKSKILLSLKTFNKLKLPYIIGCFEVVGN